jgi:hypothetical protein
MLDDVIKEMKPVVDHVSIHDLYVIIIVVAHNQDPGFLLDIDLCQ